MDSKPNLELKKVPIILIAAAAAALVYYFMRKAGALGSLIYVPRNIALAGSNITVQLGVQNPTSTPLTLRSLAGTLSFDGNAVGNISSFSPVVIAANSETPVALIVTPNVFGLFSSVMNAVTNGMDMQKLSIAGSANVDGNTLPVHIDFSQVKQTA